MSDNKKMELKRLKALEKAHQNRLYQLKLRKAKLGINTPSEIDIEIDEIQNELKEIQAKIIALQGDTNNKKRVKLILRIDFSSLSDVNKSIAVALFQGFIPPRELPSVKSICMGEITFQAKIHPKKIVDVVDVKKLFYKAKAERITLTLTSNEKITWDIRDSKRLDNKLTQTILSLLTLPEVDYMLELGKALLDKRLNISTSILDRQDNKKPNVEVFRIPLLEHIQIGVWGMRKAGKTTYLAMLFDALEQHSNWRIFTNEAGRKFITSHIKSIRGLKQFPFDTHPNKLETFEYIIYYKLQNDIENDYRRVTLTFLDVAGEFYENIEDSNENLLKYLSGCHGILFLMDSNYALKEKAFFHYLISHLLQKLRDYNTHNLDNTINSQAYLDKYLGFVATKIDEDPFWNKYGPLNITNANLQDFVIEVMGKSTYQIVKNNYATNSKRYNFFAISSIGRTYNQDTNKWDKNIDYSKDPIEIKRVKPFNNIQPLEWLIKSISLRPPKIITKD